MTACLRKHQNNFPSIRALIIHPFLKHFLASPIWVRIQHKDHNRLNLEVDHCFRLLFKNKMLQNSVYIFNKQPSMIYCIQTHFASRIAYSEFREELHPFRQCSALVEPGKIKSEGRYEKTLQQIFLRVSSKFLSNLF